MKRINYVKRMQQMNDLLEYMLLHMHEDVSADDAADHFHMNHRYFMRMFVEYYGMPFHAFMRKLRLRYAAEVLSNGGVLKGEYRRYGFQSNISFTLAFKKEFGLPPVEFAKSGQKLPPYPARTDLFGVPFQVTFTHTDDKVICGYPLPTGVGTMENPILEYAYALTHGTRRKNRPPKDKNWYGFWWYDYEKTMTMYYVWGPEGEEKEQKGQKNIVLSGGSYAVFTFPRLENDLDTSRFVNAMVMYAMKEWRILNHKAYNCMGWTYEYYEPHQISLYVPLMEESAVTMEGERDEYRMDRWTEYIDKHIAERITEADMAELSGYTEKGFHSTFMLYYGMPLKDYIRNRRAYLAAENIYVKKKTPRYTARKYGYPSVEIMMEKIKDVTVLNEEKTNDATMVPRLPAYYRQHRREIKLQIKKLEKIKALVVPLRPYTMGAGDKDIPEFSAFRFCNPQPEFEHTNYAAEKRKVALWVDTSAEDPGEDSFAYMLGPVVDTFPAKTIPAKQVEIAGGYYIVFTDEEADTRPSLAESYRLLTRVAFYGWIHENRYRYDWTRLTFVEYDGEKLLFYVPVNF